jgi:hypothetical membrane protein
VVAASKTCGDPCSVLTRLGVWPMMFYWVDAMARVGSGSKPVSRQTFKIASAACGVVAPVLSVIVAAGVGYLHPGYDSAEQRLSELGASGAPYAVVFNVAGLMASGVLVVVLSLGLQHEFIGNRLARTGGILLSVSGASLFMTGIFPCDVGFVEASASGILHGVFAAIGTLAIIGAALAMWYGLRGDPLWGHYSWFSLSVALMAVALYVTHQFSSQTDWNGAVQRMLVLVLLVWLEVMSVRLLSRVWASLLEEADRTSWSPSE